MLRVLAFDEPDVDRQAGRVRELVEEGRGEVGAEPARLRRGEVGVRGDQRTSRASTTTIASASSAGAMPKPRPGALGRSSSGAQRVSERSARALDLGLGLVRRDLER